MLRARSWLVLLALSHGALRASPAVAQVVTPTARGQGIVRGTISGRFQGELSPLPFALVEVVSGGLQSSTVGDSAGWYELARLRPGEARLAVSYPGYEALSVTVSVPDGGSVRLDFELSGAPVTLPPIEVRTDGVGGRAFADGASEDLAAPMPEVDIQTLDLGPGLGQLGLVDVVSALPGNDPADPTDVLFMRGSTTDLKLVLLDGVPVYTPFHVAGLMRTFEPGVLGSADLHVGGAPARFDGGLSHILDLRTRAPRTDRAKLSASVDMISASAAVEAPVGDRVGLLLSGRSLHDLGTVPLWGSGPYGYRDALLTVAAVPASGHELRATGFWNSESVLLDESLATKDAAWANRAGSIAYRADAGGARLELTAGASGYRAELPLQPGRTAGEPPPPALLASAETNRARLVGEATWGAPEQPIRAGLSLEQLGVALAAEELGGGPSVASEGSTRALGAFLDATRPLAPGLTLRGGVRVDRYEGRSTNVAPRIALRWELTSEALLTVAMGRYHQPTRSPEVEVERTLAEVSAEGLPPSELLPVATADHVVLSLDQRLGGKVRLGLQGFWKRFEGLPTASDEQVRNSGIDVRVLTAGDIGTVWLGYGLSWFWSKVDLSGRASEFVGRHLLSAGVSGRLGGPLRGEARIAYGAGLPYTSIPFGTADASSEDALAPAAGRDYAAEPPPLVSGLDEDFLRLDLEVHMALEPEWGGRSWQLRPYVRVLNALDRRDALFYTFQAWRSEEVRPLAERPLLPILGVSVSF